MQTFGFGATYFSAKTLSGHFHKLWLRKKSDGDSGGVSYPFDETVYLMATILDPMYPLLWVDHFISDSETVALEKAIIGRYGTFSISTKLFCSFANRQVRIQILHNHTTNRFWYHNVMRHFNVFLHQIV